MKRGQHSRKNPLFEMVKKHSKVFAISFSALILGGAVTITSTLFPSGHSYAAGINTQTLIPNAKPGTLPPTPSSPMIIGTSNGATPLYPQFPSQVTDTNYDFKGGTSFYAIDSMTLEPPVGGGGNLTGKYIFSQVEIHSGTQGEANGFAQIDPSMIPVYANVLAGYQQGGSGTLQNQWVSMITHQAEQPQYATTYKYGNPNDPFADKFYTDYGFSSFLSVAGGGFDQWPYQSINPTDTLDPEWFYSYAPEAELQVTGASDVALGGTVQFYDMERMQTFSEGDVHWENMTITDPNGKVVYDSAPGSQNTLDVTYNGNSYTSTSGGIGSSSSSRLGLPVYTDALMDDGTTSPVAADKMVAIKGGTSYPSSEKATWFYTTDGASENGWSASGTPLKITIPQGATTGTYTIHLQVADTNGRVSTPATATFSVVSPGPTTCPAPYDSNEQWTSDGNGNETFSWSYVVPTLVPAVWKNGVLITPATCKNVTTNMSQYYPATNTNGQVTALTYDPGKPGDMWLPTDTATWSTEATGSGFYEPLDSEHGWDWLSSGDPSASQITGTYTINGQTYHTYGPGQGSTPWAWARPDSGFGFRVLWTGSPHSLLTSGTVTYSLSNPDGASTSFSEPLIINSDTLQTEGTQMLGLNTPPAPASEYYSAWWSIPKTMTNKELAAWSLSGNPSTALANGAHISVSITLKTQNAGTINFNVPTMIALFNYPAWFFTSIGGNNLSQAAANGK